jgi:tetratricopeptide (TPR) repeat protein
LEAKLREALSVQPAAVDPRELTKAQEKIKTLEKERDLLKVSLEQDQAKASNVADPALLAQERQILADVKQKLAQQTERTTSLERENQDLRQQVTELKVKTQPTPSAGQQELALTEFRQRVAQQTNFIAALQAENQSLKQQMADLKSRAATAVPTSGTNQSLASSQATIASLQASNISLRAEQILLESRLAEVIRQAGPLPPGKAKDAEKQLAAVRSTARELEQERDALEKKLAAANKELAKKEPRSAPLPPPSSDLQKQLETVRARLEVYEAKQVPYAPEELALFKQPAIKVATVQPNAAPQKAIEPPPGAGALVAEAERAVATGRYAEAETKLLQVLRQDQKNIRTLANLAAVQLDQNRLNDAEKTLKQALAVDPKSAPCLFLLGDLRFRQEKYDEALEALSLSAKINPDKAETQYYLGKALIQKGSRQSAETALRRAVQLKPGWGDAHYLLAVVYATQQPPFRELAQWHYQKAVDSGAPRNVELEKVIEQAAATGTNQ